MGRVTRRYSQVERDNCVSLRKKGYSCKLISKAVGIPEKTIFRWCKIFKAMYGVELPKPKKVEEIPKHVLKKCDKCVYRSGRYNYGCNYIFLEGHSRGCPVSNCTRFIEGEKRMLHGAGKLEEVRDEESN